MKYAIKKDCKYNLRSKVYRLHESSHFILSTMKRRWNQYSALIFCAKNKSL